MMEFTSPPVAATLGCAQEVAIEEGGLTTAEVNNSRMKVTRISNANYSTKLPQIAVNQPTTDTKNDHAKFLDC